MLDHYERGRRRRILIRAALFDHEETLTVRRGVIGPSTCCSTPVKVRAGEELDRCARLPSSGLFYLNAKHCRCRAIEELLATTRPHRLYPAACRHLPPTPIDIRKWPHVDLVLPGFVRLIGKPAAIR